jgi:hypothetical protein
MIMGLFALIFGVVVGMTSLNFGTLVRYKIPSLPFFVAGMVILIYESKKRIKGV